ncbi:cyclin-SDS [Vitis riparia]|uniref:cyclin-SDS n=1 Tax=Vitis riparia TaxID=96939 RepID=UPI00155AFB76|nr:cyclin-SDS [Vitis riparia]
MRPKRNRKKRNFESLPYNKKLRSKLPRRRRSQISPILYTTSNSNAFRTKSGLHAFPLRSSSSSYNSSRISSFLRKREFEEIGASGAVIRGNEKVRRITRSYYRQKQNERKLEIGDGGVEASESSCVESCSGADVRVSAEASSKFKRKNAENAKIIGGSENPEAVLRSEISSIQQIAGENLKSDVRNIKKSSERKDNDVTTSVTSGVELPSEMKFPNASSPLGNRALESEISRSSRNYVDANFTVSNSSSNSEQMPKGLVFDCDLCCSEYLSYDEVSDYSSSHEMLISEMQTDVLPENPELDFSDYTPSLFFESGSEFSERSEGDSTRSPTFSLFVQYNQQFSRLASRLDARVSSSLVQNEYRDEFTLLRFEDEDDEESYQRFRSRERKACLHDYGKEYCSKTEYGGLVAEQRLLMVHWILEQSAAKELQKETLFLGVNLLDRFLSKGFFKNKRSLQIVGIACLTLATRIEENQPYNSLRQKTFCIGNNVFNRREVIAMEWLVQEVLNFQCFMPTTYNFLWFYLKAARASAEVERMAKYLAVLALLDHEQLCYWRSTVAAGLVILASLAANQDASCQRVMETHVRTKDDDLPECIKSMEWLVKYVS